MTGRWPPYGPPAMQGDGLLALSPALRRKDGALTPLWSPRYAGGRAVGPLPRGGGGDEVSAAL